MVATARRSRDVEGALDVIAYNRKKEKEKKEVFC